jgi:hypothetical protein
MCFLVIEQLPGTIKACGRDHNNGNPEKDEGEPVVTAKPPRQERRPHSTSAGCRPAAHVWSVPEGHMVSARTRMVVYSMSSALAVSKLSIDSRKKLDAMVATLRATIICRQPVKRPEVRRPFGWGSVN